MKRAPHSFVINKGLIGRNVNKLIQDLRLILEPNTAKQLKVKKTNLIKDFISVASIFHVTHLICLTKTRKNIFLRFCRVPNGPTLYFKIKNYMLGKDVRSNLRRPLMNQKLFQKSPLLVMNSFQSLPGQKEEEAAAEEQKPHLKLITSMFKTMFPFIDINNVKLRTVKRCVMLNYNQDTGLIDLRHYAIKIKPVGLSKPVKKLVASKRIPNLSKLKSFDEIMDVEHGFTSESDGELDELEEQRHVTVSEPMKSSGNLLFEKSAVRCIEIGPRITMELVRITDGLCKGKIMYNKLKNGDEFLDFNQQNLEHNDLEMENENENEQLSSKDEEDDLNEEETNQDSDSSID